ncbi:MAG: hypothetical protein M3Y88_08225 [Chloroflexota bacterium]|nr:hypothetical protein [Chloroflexota bacterium]
MSIRLDPRRLGKLKQLAAEAGLRPGEIVLQWVEERLDGGIAPAPASQLKTTEPFAALNRRVDELATRLDALAAAQTRAAERPAPAPTTATDNGAEQAPPARAQAQAASEASPEVAAAPTPRRRGRPRKETVADAAPPTPRRRATGTAATATPRRKTSSAAASAPRRRRSAANRGRGSRVPLHDEIIAVIGERGPLRAAEIATAVTERGRYVAPRSGKKLDAAAVNSRVSNPVYRARFTRSDGRIGLSTTGD